MRHKPEGARTNRLLVGALVLLLLFAFFDGAFEPLVSWYEHTRFERDPSAQRAMMLGTRHFNARDTVAYDIDAAEYYFREAEHLDPDTPYLYHQLARVAFIRGDLDMALALIDIQIEKAGDSAPNSYYIKGLIEGYKGLYADAVRDYYHYVSLRKTPSWAAYNDLAWVLLKAERTEEARRELEKSLAYFPDNPWLLNSYGVALFEVGQDTQALEALRHAAIYAPRVSKSEWLAAYPGNSPRSAEQGLQTLTDSIEANIHMVQARLGVNDVQ